MTDSKANLNESINVSNSWDEIRNKWHQMIFQLYILSSISVVLKQHNRTKKFIVNQSQNRRTTTIRQQCKHESNCPR